jgi:RNA polymerase sigma-32 factor
MGIEGQFKSLTAQTRRELASDGRGKGYLSEIRRFPVLEKDEEYMLAKRWREQGDRDAGNQLVTSHMRLAVKVAMGYRGYGLPVAEIISEGNIGLLQALNRFEPEMGFRFATYAIWWIRASIQDYILRSWSLVKIGTTTSQKKLFFKLRSAKSKIAAFENGDLQPDQVALIARSLAVSDQDVVDMNRRLRGDKSINAPLRDDDEAAEWQDYLVDQAPSPEAIVVEQDERDYQHNALIAAIDVLNDRERRIFEARHLADEPLTLEQLAVKFNVSRERVRQIEVRAFEKVRKAAKNIVAKAPTATQEAWRT